MQKLQGIVSNIIWLLLVLLAFLLIFESQVVVPYWMQPLGRMHPMLLHFPIALIVVMVLLDHFRSHLDQSSYEKVHFMALNLTTLTTALSALMGFLLSKEEGYTSELMELHKWVGVTVTYLICVMLLVKPQSKPYKFLLYGSFIILFFAGHFGAGLTHGMDFLMEPIARAKPPEITPETPVFQAFVAPILEEKCQGCHNQQKHKGDLDMTTYDLLLEGGEHGPVLVAGNALESEMIHRALLPMAMEEHMPPEGKPQLTDRELELLTAWIDAGADPEISLSELSSDDTLYHLAQARLQELQTPEATSRYEFEFASEKLVASLNNPYRSVIQETPESPALNVSLYVRQAYQKEYLEGLNKIKDQIVTLNLSYMPVEDEDLKLVGRFPNLETLNLNYTNITGAGLEFLSGCERLKSLSLSGTGVNGQIAGELSKMESLQELYLWNTEISDRDMEALSEELPQVDIITGYLAGQEPPLPLTSPQLGNKSAVLAPGEPVVLEHKLSGVIIKYTTDGSDPDSVSAPEYTDPIPVQGYKEVKTVAYKDRWLTSDTASYMIYTHGKTPVTVQLEHQPNPDYPGKGALSLTDKQRGMISNFRGKEWLGFRESAFSATFDFGDQPPEISQVLLCYGLNTGSQIMSPAAVKIWGGNDPDNMKVVTEQIIPADEKGTPRGEKMVPIDLGSVSYRYYKIEGQPLARLPSWHNAKGQPAWLFVDELFFY